MRAIMSKIYPKKRQRRKNQKVIRHKSATKRKNERKNKAPMEEFMIEKIVDHETNTSGRHRNSKAEEKLYGVRWYGYETVDVKREPTRHIPRGKVLK